MNSRTQFTFYESFFKALARIRKDADRAKAYDAICRFALYGEEANLDSLPDAAAVAYEIAVPVLEASRRKSKAGKKGGEAKTAEANGSKPEANRSKAEAKQKQEQEKEQVQVQVQVQVKDKEQMLYTPSPDGEGEGGEAPPTPPRPRFVPPTEEEVREYCRVKGYAVDPEAFVAFYASKGWKVGSQPMKDWRMALVTWVKRDGGAQSNDPWKRRTPDLQTQEEKSAELQDQFAAMSAAAQWGGG